MINLRSHYKEKREKYLYIIHTFLFLFLFNRDAVHHCVVCVMTFLNLFEFSQHISTARHQDLLKATKSTKTKALSLAKTLPIDVLERIFERNRVLKKKNKKNKKLNQKHQDANTSTSVPEQQQQQHKQHKQQKPKPSQVDTNTKKLEKHQTGGIHVVVRIKENKATSQQGGSDQLSARTWNQNCTQQKITHQKMNKDNCSVHQLSTKVTVETSQTQRQFTHPKRPKDGPPKQTTLSGNSHNDSRQARTTSVQSRPKDMSSFPNCPPENRSSDAAPTSHDVASLLKQIRRELGVREPCRAEREARKHSITPGARSSQSSIRQQTEGQKEQLPEASSEQFWTVCNRAAAAEPCLQSRATPGAANRQPQEVTANKTSRKIRIAHKPVNPPPAIETSLRQTVNKLLSSSGPGREIILKPTVNNRLSSSSSKKEIIRKSTVNKRFSFSSPRTRQSWMEIYNDLRRNKQEMSSRCPRYDYKCTTSVSVYDTCCCVSLQGWHPADKSFS